MNWPWDKMKVNSQICFQQDPDKEVEDSNWVEEAFCSLTTVGVEVFERLMET